jgi:CRISPR-associated endonuclease Csn1
MRSGQVTLAEHFEAGNLKARDTTKDDSFSYLNASASFLTQTQARKIFIDPAGRIRDPGPRAMP